MGLYYSLLRHKKSTLLVLGLVLGSVLVWMMLPEDRSVQGKTFRIARDPSWEPVDLMGKAKNVSAFSDELLFHIAKENDFTIDMITASREQLLLNLRDGLFDAVLYPVTNRWHIFGVYLFSQPYFALGPVMVLRKGEVRMTPEEMKGKTIGIERGSYLLTKLDQYPDVNITPFDNIFQGMESLINDRIDALIIDAMQAYLYIEGMYKGKLHIAGPALTKSGIKMLTANTDRGEALLESFNEGLQASMESGEYAKLLDKWGFTNYPKPLFETIEKEQPKTPQEAWDPDENGHP